jgi:CDP-glycerol glycerophosphotransferase
MKSLFPAIGWWFVNLFKLPGNILSLFIRWIYPVKKGTVMCWAYNFKQYGCNPRYLTEYMLENADHNFDLYWVVRKNVNTEGIDKRIKIVKFRSLEYFRLVNTAEFLITNARIEPYRIYWHKRKEQKYLMLWHGGVALKRIEKDAEANLSFTYLQRAKHDSKVCNLMISGCNFQTKLLKEKFWYSGEILEKGIPRNDIFFKTELHEEMKKRIISNFNIPEDNVIVLYAPTFRRNKKIDPYKINWNNVIPALQEKFGNKGVTVLLRLHPNLIGSADVTPLLNNPAVIDATLYHDMQELLCISDMLITDYSSSMFDFSMQMKPCLLYATDVAQYDRGYYFDFRELPYPLATDESELIDNIKNFDKEKYNADLKQFFDVTVGLFEDGNASKSLTDWMQKHRLQ